MSEKLLASAVERLSEASKEAVWRQWRALGAMASNSRPAVVIVDPEALVLLSLALAEEERRLWDMLGWWARVGSTLLSVQRMKNLKDKYPDAVRSRLGEFARLALREGGDFRWRPLAHPSSGRRIRLEKGLGQRLELVDSPALILRLRIGLGVGVKADVLSFLLGVGGAWVSARSIAGATDYSVRAIRRAAEEMAAARLIQATAEKPAEYRADPKPWGELLGASGGNLAWRYWQAVFAFVAHLREWKEKKGPAKASAYIVSSSARELVEGHQAAFKRNRIAIPDPDDYPGEKYLKAFEETLSRLALWMEESV